LGIFYKICRKKFKFNQNLTRITGILHEDLCVLMITSQRILLKMRNVSDKIFIDNKTQTFYPLTFSLKPCRLRGTVKKYGRTEETTHDTRSEYGISIGFP
jgi:hypothetical protein